MALTDEGGVVTTVKESTTKDLDVVAQLSESGDGEQPTKEDKKPEAKETPVVKVPKAPEFDDEDDRDFYNSMTPDQQKQARRFFKSSRETRRELREMKDEIRQLRQQPKGKTKAEPAPVKGIETARTLDELGDIPKYPDAKTWKGTQEEFDKKYEDAEEERYQWRKAKERVEQAEVDARKRDEKVVADFQTEQAKFIEEHDDYEEIVDNKEPMTNTMFGAVMKKGPALLYHWAKNKDEARAIHAMGDTQEAVEAILEAWVTIKLEAKAAAKAKSKENEEKPPKEKHEIPPTPVGGRGAAPAAQRDMSKMSFKEREKLIHKRNPGSFKYEP